MNEKILAAIEETLPEMQVTAIRKALIELESLRVEVAAVRAESDQYKKWWSEERQRAQKLETQYVELGELNVKIVASNVELMAKDAEARVALAEGKLEATNSTVDKFLKNTIYREALQHQVSDEFTTVNTQYINGQQIAIPTPGKTHRGVTDVKERTTE